MAYDSRWYVPKQQMFRFVQLIDMFLQKFGCFFIEFGNKLASIHSSKAQDVRYFMLKFVYRAHLRMHKKDEL